LLANLTVNKLVYRFVRNGLTTSIF